MIKSLLTTVMMLLLVTVITLVSPSVLHAMAPAKGLFLVADERMVDPRFKARVILLIRHDADGSAGLVINRSSRLPLDAVLPKETRLDLQGRTLSYGGPVDPQTLLALVKVRTTPAVPAEKILANLYLTGGAMLSQWPELDDELLDFRVFAGYAGWGPGQLDGEMQRGSWHLMPADEESVFAGQDEALWESLQSGKAAGN